MITILPTLLLSFAGQVRLSEVIHAPMDRLTHILGRGIAPKRVPAIYFNPPGFREVRIDSAGEKMSSITVSFLGVTDWRAALMKVGVDPSHVKTSPISLPHADIPLERNSLTLKGTPGLPSAKGGGKAWVVTYSEVAESNSKRAKLLREKIHASTGAARLDLIRSCYDWHSVIQLHG